MARVAAVLLLVAAAAVCLHAPQRAAAQTTAAKACTDLYGSDFCACSDTHKSINCGFRSLTFLPVLTGTTATREMYFYNNQLAALPSLPGYFQMRKLHFRNNLLTRLPTTIFADMNLLEELHLDNNKLTSLQVELFDNQANLKILRLGSNLLTTLPVGIFGALTNLEELRLDNNKLTQVSASLISSNVKLKAVHLERNDIRQIPVGFLSGLTALEEVYFNLNPLLRVIPQNTFAGLTKLKEVGMLGSYSTCDKPRESVPIFCACGPGYTGDGTFCEARDCGPTILDLGPNTNSACTGTTTFTPDFSTTCQGRCDLGFEGGPATFTCNTVGIWEGELTCTPVDCGPNIIGLDPNANADCAGDTRFGGDNCVATCREGFIGTETFVCNKFAQWEGSLTCEAVDCGPTIQNLDKFATASCTGNTKFEGDSCFARCNPGYVGDGGVDVEFTCDPSGLWFGVLSCSGIECGRTIDDLPPNSNARCRGNTAFRGDNCTAQCDPGYDGGSTTYVCQENADWTTDTPLNCERKDCGPTIPDLDPNAVASPCTSTLFNDTCQILCDTGYVETSTAVDLEPGVFRCDEFGLWAGSLVCERRDCGATVLGLDGNATANCSSIDSRYLGDACTANCSQGYLGGTRDFTCDPSGVWVHPLGLDYCYPESEPCAVEVGRVDDVTDPKATLQTQYIEARLECPAGLTVKDIAYANFGDSSGTCGYLEPGSCVSDNALEVTRRLCVGRSACTLRNSVFNDPCFALPLSSKGIQVQARCGVAASTSSSSGGGGSNAGVIIAVVVVLLIVLIVVGVLLYRRYTSNQHKGSHTIEKTEVDHIEARTFKRQMSQRNNGMIMNPLHRFSMRNRNGGGAADGGKAAGGGASNNVEYLDVGDDVDDRVGADYRELPGAASANKTGTIQKGGYAVPIAINYGESVPGTAEYDEGSSDPRGRAQAMSEHGVLDENTGTLISGNYQIPVLDSST